LFFRLALFITWSFTATACIVNFNRFISRHRDGVWDFPSESNPNCLKYAEIWYSSIISVMGNYRR